MFIKLPALLCSIVLLANCGEPEPSSADVPHVNVAQEQETDPSNSENTLVIDNSGTEIAIMTQEYIDGSIVEIPYITYDGQQPALAAYGGKNPEIELINNEIKNGIQQTYLAFQDTHAAGETIQIRTYPFESDDYLQLVITYAQYPSYGTDGQLWSYHFDKIQNRSVELDEVLADNNLTRAAVEQEIRRLFVPEQPGMSVSQVEIAGFTFYDYSIRLLLNVTVDRPQAEPWTSFYAYFLEPGKLKKLDAQRLFDPVELLPMDPPLSVQNAAAQSLRT